MQNQLQAVTATHMDLAATATKFKKLSESPCSLRESRGFLILTCRFPRDSGEE
jgi:hypothetical protein